MTNEEAEQLRRDHDYWTEKHKALAESVELLAGSARDLRAVVEADIARDRERWKIHDERSARYLKMLADVFRAWAEDHGDEVR